MIQRVQSLFLLGAAVCFGWACFVPIGMFKGSEMFYVYTPWVLKQDIVNGLNVQETYYIGLLQCILAVISFAAIFFYKNRPLQSKICTSAIIISFMLLVLILFVYPDRIFPQIFILLGEYVIGSDALNGVRYSPWIALSVLPVAFLYLANKFIVKDEKKVRAADRLR